MKSDKNIDLYYSIYKGKKDIIFKEENLPFPYVHSGINYFAFSKSKSSKPYVCSCQRESISNSIELYLKYYLYNGVPTNIMDSIIGFLNLPAKIQIEFNGFSVYETQAILNRISFKDKVCHLCNNITPTTPHSICIYESKLNQQYGHYINSLFYTYGISNHLPDFYGIYFLPDKMPEDFKRILIPSKEEIFVDIINYSELSTYIQNKVKKTLNLLWNLSSEERDTILYNRNLNKDKRLISYKLKEEYNLDSEVIGYIQNSIHKRFLSVKKIIVDEVKQSFKLRRWVNESVLANVVQELFKEYTIYRNYRPSILEGLELDIYIQELKLGIEYQGIQHVKSIKHWGGEEDLKIRKEHDKRKAELCKMNGIELIYFWYDENINKELVLSKLGKYIDK